MYTIEELEAHIENIAKLKAEFESASSAILPPSPAALSIGRRRRLICGYGAGAERRYVMRAGEDFGLPSRGP